MPDLSSSVSRIHALANLFHAKRYLEIGVFRGDTFFAVNLPYKVGVDPDFQFDPAEHAAPDVYFFPGTSDEFFASQARGIDNSAKTKERTAFDIIFIDGLHTFEQSFRDFKKSLDFACENTVWLLDDTVPSDAYSAVPDQQKSCALRKFAGLSGCPWHGDVFKTVFAIHDRYPEFSYCTLMGGNPQTIVWRHGETEKTEQIRASAFTSLEEIAALSYFDMLEHARLLMPVEDRQLFEFVGKALDPTGQRLDLEKFSLAPVGRERRIDFFRRLNSLPWRCNWQLHRLNHLRKKMSRAIRKKIVPIRSMCKFGTCKSPL